MKATKAQKEITKRPMKKKPTGKKRLLRILVGTRNAPLDEKADVEKAQGLDWYANPTGFVAQAFLCPVSFNLLPDNLSSRGVLLWLASGAVGGPAQKCDKCGAPVVLKDLSTKI